MIARGRVAHPPRGATAYMRPVSVLGVLAVNVPDVLHHLKAKHRKGWMILFSGVVSISKGRVSTIMSVMDEEFMGQSKYIVRGLSMCLTNSGVCTSA